MEGSTLSFRWHSDDWGVLGDALVVFLVYGALFLAMCLWAT